MLPIILNDDVAVGLAGEGDAHARRQRLLTEAGIAVVAVSAKSGEAALRRLSVLFIAGLQSPDSLVKSARAAGVLVNVEDVPALCDFHVPALLRRGDLLLTVSTGGRAPGLSGLIRNWLEQRFAASWAGWLDEAEAARRRWRAEGLSMSEVKTLLAALAAEKEWLP